MDVSKNRGTPKWMVKIMETLIKMDDLVGKTHYFRKHRVIKSRDPCSFFECTPGTWWFHPFKMVLSICWMFPNLPLWDGCLTKHPHKTGCLVFQAHTQCGGLSVIHGVITPTVYKWPYKWVTGIITPISGVIILLMNGRGPHCTISSGLKNTGKQWKTLAFPKLMYVYVYIIVYANIYHKI